MSGVGTNAEILLKQAKKSPSAHYRIALIVTDAPNRSRAAELAQTYDVPLVALDIHAFYREHQLETISLATHAGREVRELWTQALRKLIEPYGIDFGILAGFVPLTNLTADYPCLNVHPADLTVCDAEGKRLLAGLHTVPMENALCGGYPELRSSVILAQPFTGSGKDEMDSGPVLGVSTPVVPILDGHCAEELRAVRAARVSGKRPPEGDLLSRLAARNLDHLKKYGDHVVFPPVIEAFAAGCYGEADGRLYFRHDASAPFESVKTVEFGTESIQPVR